MANNVPTTGDLLEVPSGVARLRYFYGQLLTQRDLQAEQGYHLLLQRLMQREICGTGTLAGLGVEAAGASAPKNVYVRAGIGLDPDGRELILISDACITIAEPPLEGPDPSLGAPEGDSSDQIATWLAGVWGITVDHTDIEQLSEKLIAAGLSGDSGGTYQTTREQLQNLSVPSPLPTIDAEHPLADYLFDALVGTTYIGLRYVERGKEPSPAVLDGSCCGETTCFPSRTEEGVFIVASDTEFPAVVDPYAQAEAFLQPCLQAKKDAANGDPDFDGFAAIRECLAAYVTNASSPVTFRGLPPADGVCGPPAPPVVPLARAYWSRFDITGQSRILSVDNASFRPIALGAQTIRALFQASMQTFT